MTEEMLAALDDFERGAFTPREMLALRFATLMAQDHHKLDDAFFGELRGHFTDAEIIELGMVTGQFLGFGRLVAALDLENPQEPLPPEGGRFCRSRRPIGPLLDDLGGLHQDRLRNGQAESAGGLQVDEPGRTSWAAPSAGRPGWLP